MKNQALISAMHIYQDAKRCNPNGMDIYSIRKANLLQLMRGRTKTACADKWDTSASTLSQITSKKPNRNLGDALARKIERAEGLPNGWLDVEQRGLELASSRPTYKPDSNAAMVEAEVVEDGEPLRYDEVWLPVFREVEFAAGDGATQVIENHGAQERFSLPRLARAGVQPQNAALASVRGDSMAPTITDGATIGIDKGCRTITDGSVYALDHGGMLRIKKLYRMPLNRMRVVSENGDEYPEEVYSLADPDAPRIIGRVFWVENFL